MAAVVIDHFADDGESESRSIRFSVGGERVEKPFADLLRNAGAVVLTRNEERTAVRLTLDAGLQKTAEDALAYGIRLAHDDGQWAADGGAVVAMDPNTGEILALASNPTFDPSIYTGRVDKKDLKRLADPSANHPTLDRAVQGLYPPGSTFKVVTASAALETNRFSPDSEFYDPGYCIAYGKRVNNFDTSSPFGNLSLATALQHSVNSVFCNVGKALGAKRILDQAKKFGFYERPPLETPDGERYPSGLYRNGELWYPKRDSDVDAGRMAFGQERMLVTPLQMAMVAAGIGNAGIVMRPYVVEKIVSPKGQTVSRTERQRLDRAVGPVNARDIADMMVSAVQAGTGTAAQIPGYRVGGKTGTAETGISGQNTTWFIAFAGRPGRRPEVAIAVALERQSLTGGATAAPIARTVMESLLRRGGNP